MFPLGILSRRVSSFIQGVFTTNLTSVHAVISESGRLFTSVYNGSTMRAIVDRTKTTGKWFYAVELVSFTNNTYVYTVGIATEASPLTATSSLGGPNTKQHGYGKFLGSKKWVGGTSSAFGTLSVAGGIVGISYDASTGEIRGYRYISGAWVDDGVITTVSANSPCTPMVWATGASSLQTSLRLRSDLGSPAGFGLWA